MLIAEQQNNISKCEKVPESLRSLSPGANTSADINIWNNSPESVHVLRKLNDSALPAENILKHHSSLSEREQYDPDNNFALAQPCNSNEPGANGDADGGKDLLDISHQPSSVALTLPSESSEPNTEVGGQGLSSDDVKPVTESCPHNNRGSSLVNGQPPVSIQQVTGESCYFNLVRLIYMALTFSLCQAQGNINF